VTLTDEEKARRNQLSEITTGSDCPELDDLNKRNNKDKPSEELFETIHTRSDGGPQARAELRKRGFNV